jgi:N-acetylmuramoyl-L-alanine amidase CwlA
MKLVKDIIPKSKWDIKCPYSMAPEFVVVHNTANDASAKNEVAYMKNNNNSTSFHFAVDDIEARQAIPLDRNAWHAGDGGVGNGNRCGIGIEICYSKSGGAKFEKAEENTARFIAELLKEYGWGIARVKKHQDFANKYCPHRTLDLGWERFIKKIERYMNSELTTINDIVWELANRGIITDKDLWLDKLENDQNAYWLARKCANYIREKDI